QSPLIESDYRHEELGGIVYNENFNTLVNVGNYWKDSNIILKGFVDERTAAYVLWSDTAPSSNMNAVPIIPLYLGEGEDLEGYEKGDNDHSLLDVIYGGTVPKESLKKVPEFDFDLIDKEKFYVPLSPLMRE